MAQAGVRRVYLDVVRGSFALRFGSMEYEGLSTLWLSKVALPSVMRGFTTRVSWISPLGEVVLLMLTALHLAPVTPLTNDIDVSPETACKEFSAAAYGNTWSVEDCVHVWSEWVATVPSWLHQKYQDRELLNDISVALRQRGTPCLVESNAGRDGAGSSTVRHLAAWVLARDLGCEWVKPEWATPKVLVPMEEGTTVYCHSKKNEEERNEPMSVEQRIATRACQVVSWLYYFHFDVSSVEYPAGRITNVVIADALHPIELSAAVDDAIQMGLDTVPWDTIVLKVTQSMASRYMVAVGSWDSFKRGIVRDVLKEMRKNFHVSPRPWYDANPSCSYSDGELNFAIHVRMGDRRLITGTNDDYFGMLEALMDSITESVLTRRSTPPKFHVFTETLLPCPSGETGAFGEFASWPVELSQVPACYDEDPVTDCLPGMHGMCARKRSGIFRVSGKPIVLHVGEDATNALSCMALADGVVMGCSAFGQMAGLLSYGISMFSISCDGPTTPPQYKMVPPMAIAEHGNMWVPMEGSWRDPRLYSIALFDKALDQHLATQGSGMQ